MVNEINTYQRLSWVGPKWVQSRILSGWQKWVADVLGEVWKSRNAFPELFPKSAVAVYYLS